MDPNQTTNETADTNTDTVVVEATEATTTKRAKAKSVDDVTFIEICERVAESDDPSIKHVVEKLRELDPEKEPMQEGSVTARRSTLRKLYGASVLQEYPRGGGGNKAKDVDATLAKINEMKARLAAEKDKSLSEEADADPVTTTEDEG